MGVVLPSETDAAMDLDAELRVVHRCRHRANGRDRRSEAQLLTASQTRPARVPGGPGGELCRYQHVRAVMLDGLEHPDRPPKLDPGLGVIRGPLRRLSRYTSGLRGE